MIPFRTSNGDYLLFTRRGGFLHEDALKRFCAAAEGGAEFIYADEAYILEDGSVRNILKPEYSPDTLLAIPYIGSPFALKRKLYETIQSPPAGTDEELANLILLAEERANGVIHIPELLYTGPESEPFPYGPLIDRAMNRRGRSAEAAPGHFPGSCCLRFGIPKDADVAVVVPFTGNIDAVRQTLEAVDARCFGIKVQFYVPYSCLADLRAERYLNALIEHRAAKVCCAPDCKKKQTLKNHAARLATERLILFLDAGVEPVHSMSILRMAEFAAQPNAGAVGAKIVSPDRKLIHAGFLLGVGLLPETLMWGHPENERSFFFDRYVNCIRNVSAVGGGALMTERDLFLACRAFDDTMPDYAADAEFCARVMRMGRYNVYQPYARFCRQQEIGPDPGPEELLRLRDAFFSFMERGDPMLSLNPEIVSSHWADPPSGAS